MKRKWRENEEMERDFFLSRHTAKSCLFNYLTFESNSYQHSLKKLLEQTTLRLGIAHFAFKVLLDVLVHSRVWFFCWLDARARSGSIETRSCPILVVVGVMGLVLAPILLPWQVTTIFAGQFVRVSIFIGLIIRVF